jgi:hypothetical protein
MISKKKSNEPQWYTQYPMLNRALVLLKPLSLDIQEVVGKELYNYAKELSFDDYDVPENAEIVSQVGLQRLKQVIQNKGHNSAIYRALNEIMALNHEGRTLAGQRLLLCLQALECLQRQQGQNHFINTQKIRIEVYTIVRLVFEKDIEIFEEQGKQRKADREMERAEEEMAKAILLQVAQEMELLGHTDSSSEEDKALAQEMSNFEAYQEKAPQSFKPYLKRVGRFLTLLLPIEKEEEPKEVENLPPLLENDAASSTTEGEMTPINVVFSNHKELPLIKPRERVWAMNQEEINSLIENTAQTKAVKAAKNVAKKQIANPSASVEKSSPVKKEATKKKVTQGDDQDSEAPPPKKKKIVQEAPLP